jgi:hypothetical protein
VAAKVLTERALPPSEYSPAIWAELEDVVLGALAQDPDDRYPDMRSFAAALRRAVLQRGASTALVPLEPVAEPIAETSRPRHFTTRRLSEVDTALVPVVGAPGALVRVRGAATAGTVKRTRWRVIMPVAGLLSAAVLVLICAFSALAFTGNLSSVLRAVDAGYDMPSAGAGLPQLGSGSGPYGQDPTVTAGATATVAKRGWPWPVSSPTAIPTPTPAGKLQLLARDQSLNPCKRNGKDNAFTILYTGLQSTVTYTATASDSKVTLWPTSGTLQSGATSTVYASTSSASPGHITVTISSLSLSSTISYHC